MNPLKKILKNIKGVCFRILRKMPLRNILLFESVPDLSDNTKAVFDEMLRRGWNKRYRLVWQLGTRAAGKALPQIKNVRYCLLDSKRSAYYHQVAKAKICCNRFLCQTREDQLCLYLSHGTSLKHVREYYNIPNGIDYVLTASPQVADLQAWELNFDPSLALPLGFPRNDALTPARPRDIKPLLNTDCRKIIVWYPTFRQHKNGLKSEASHAIPLLHSAELAASLNEAAKQNDTLLVIKPHFAQDMSYIQELSLSHIRLIDDAFYERNGLSSYEFLAASDALITDYSSVYYDYTLCDKPVAAVWEDIEDYRKAPGLVEDYAFLMKGAEKLYTLEDLCAFVSRVGQGVDHLKKERREIRDYSNYAADGKNSERVVDFIEAKLNKM